jgi:hypothetical protein
MIETDAGLWDAVRALAAEFSLEERPGGGMMLDPMYGEELAYATLQFGDDGLLWLGLQDGRVLVEPLPEGA